MKTVENKIFPSIMFVSCFLSHLYLCTLFSSARMRTFLGGWAGVYYRNSCFLSFLFTFFPIKEVKLSNSPMSKTIFIILFFPSLLSPNATNTSACGVVPTLGRETILHETPHQYCQSI